jgi:hypothetical protein
MAWNVEIIEELDKETVTNLPSFRIIKLPTSSISSRKISLMYTENNNNTMSSEENMVKVNKTAVKIEIREVRRR